MPTKTETVTIHLVQVNHSKDNPYPCKACAVFGYEPGSVQDRFCMSCSCEEGRYYWREVK